MHLTRKEKRKGFRKGGLKRRQQGKGQEGISQGYVKVRNISEVVLKEQAVAVPAGEKLLFLVFVVLLFYELYLFYF